MSDSIIRASELRTKKKDELMKSLVEQKATLASLRVSLIII